MKYLPLILTLGLTGCATINPMKADSETNPAPAAACFAPANTLYQMVRLYPDKTGLNGPVFGRFDPKTQRMIPQQSRGSYSTRNISTSATECADVTVLEFESGNRGLEVYSCSDGKGMFASVRLPKTSDCLTTLGDSAVYVEKACQCRDGTLDMRVDGKSLFSRRITPENRANYERTIEKVVGDMRQPRYVSAPKTPQNPPQEDINRIIESCTTIRYAPGLKFHWNTTPACAPETIVTKLCYGSNAATSAADSAAVKKCTSLLQENQQKCFADAGRNREDLLNRLRCSKKVNQKVLTVIRGIPNIR